MEEENLVEESKEDLPVEDEQQETIPEDIPEEIVPEVIEEIYDPENDLQLQELIKLNETYSSYLEKQETDRLVEEEKDAEFRSQVIELITPSDEPEEEVTSEEVQLLQTLVEQTVPKSEQSQMDTAAYYGNLSIIILVMGILPVYVAYRFINGIFSLVRHVL